MQPKVLIVGAGPTGLTAAIELARHGIIPTIIDKKDQASTLSRAVGITPKSLEILAQSGVDKKLIAQGIALEHNQIYWEDKLCLSVPLNSEQSYFHTLIALPQDQTEKVLIERLEGYGGEVSYGVEFLQLKQRGSDHGFQVHVELCNTDEDAFEQVFDYVFAADGIDSLVRQGSQIPYLGYDLESTWSIADVEFDNWPHPNDFCLFKLSLGRVLVVVNIGGQRYRLVSNTPDAIDALPLKVVITNKNREGTFKIAVRQAESYTKGHVFLGGDAAHCHSPVGGRGMNLGIADAAQWVDCLINDRLDEYSEIRHAAGKSVMRMTERGRQTVSSTAWFRNGLFRIFLGIAKYSQWIKKRMGRFFIEV